MTTDDLALFLTVVLVLVLPLLFFARRAALRAAYREDYDNPLPPNSLSEWQRRAEASQARSDARR
jgi:hypothetical protein